MGVILAFLEEKIMPTLRQYNMKEFKKPFFIAVLYLMITIMLLLLDRHFLLSGVIRYGTSGPNYNLHLAHIYENYRSILDLLIIPLIIFIGSLHTLLKLPLSKSNKKYIIYISLVVALVIVPICFVYVSKISLDGSMVFLGLPLFSLIIASIFVIISALMLLAIKFIKKDDSSN